MIRSAEFWGGLFWLALGAFLAWQGRDLGLGRLNDPGSGFALLWIGAIMMALASAVILGAFRHPGQSVASLWTETRWRKLALVVALLLGFALAFERIGFVPGAVALLLALMLLVDPVDPRKAVPLAVSAPIAIWFVVTKLLKIQLPVGTLW
ncbi:MAG: tripartite tricarboxylate transporter TctB family protein [Beijerinckiaceae bacterium]